MTTNLREKTRRWGAWAGTRSDLAHVVEVIEQQMAPVIEVKRKELLQPAQKLFDDNADTVRVTQQQLDALASNDVALPEIERRLALLQSSQTTYRSLLASQTAQFEAQYRLVIETTDKHGDVDKQSGSSLDIVRRIDAKATKRFAIRVPGSGIFEAYFVEFAEDFVGRLVLTVKSSDSQWALAAFHEISSEINKNRLGWGWLRRFDLLIPLWYVASVVIWAFVFVPVSKDLATAVTAAASVSLILTGLLWLIVRWLVPATQLLREGKKPRAYAVGIIIAGAAFQVALAIMSVVAPSLLGL